MTWKGLIGRKTKQPTNQPTNQLTTEFYAKWKSNVYSVRFGGTSVRPFLRIVILKSQLVIFFSQ